RPALDEFASVVAILSREVQVVGPTHLAGLARIKNTAAFHATATRRDDAGTTRNRLASAGHRVASTGIRAVGGIHGCIRDKAALVGSFGHVATPCPRIDRIGSAI